jgi:hypothetical protein
MVEEKDTGWWELLHKNGLIQVTDILETYAIDSVTDMSEFKKDDFSELEVLGVVFLVPFILLGWVDPGTPTLCTGVCGWVSRG